MPTTPASVRCLKCGNTWSARKAVTSKPRQCPKCFSREVEERQDDEAGGAKMSESPHVFDENDDPEVQEKLKELRLAELDKKIQDVRGELTRDAADVLATSFLRLIDHLSNKGDLDTVALENLASDCPWCGAEGELKHLSYLMDGADYTGFRCKSCRRRAVWGDVA